MELNILLLFDLIYSINLLFFNPYPLMKFLGVILCTIINVFFLKNKIKF